jgi:hypothetical protein
MSFSSLSSYRSTAVCWWQYGKKKEGSEKKNNNSKKKTKKKKKRKKKRKIFHIPHSATRISHPIEKKKKKKKKTNLLQKWSILSIVSKQATNHIIFFVMNWQFEKLDSCGHSASKRKLTKTPGTGRCGRVCAKKRKRKRKNRNELQHGHAHLSAMPHPSMI